MHSLGMIVYILKVYHPSDSLSKFFDHFSDSVITHLSLVFENEKFSSWTAFRLEYEWES